MLDDRKLAVLRAIVEDFVSTNEPVGSRALVDRHNLDVSPATIRNDMAVLEEQGYIVQPHTSAGGVPTDKGYRLFVDRLSAIKPLSAAERRAIETFLAGAYDLDDVVMRTVRLLAQLTRQVAVVQYPSLSKSSVRHLELVPLTDRRLLVAAFDGGFKLLAHVGGYEQEGRIISPLVPGRASLVIYRSGQASVGIWGQGVPRPGPQVYSVRQNLTLLVRNGRPTPASVAGWGYWGGTITGVENTARSALGENAKGQLIYVASMSASPPDLAVTLVKAGAVIGMELDINAEWVQLAYSTRPGGQLLPGVTGQVRPADQYLRGWTRDFIAVIAEWPATVPGGHAAPWPVS